MKCVDNTFYTGITQNLSTRLSQHLKGQVSYTRNRHPCKLIHTEQRDTRKEAAKHERYIKTIGAKKYLIRNFAEFQK